MLWAHVLSQQLMSKLGKKFVIAWQLQHISDNFVINWPDQSTPCHAKIPTFAILWGKLIYLNFTKSKQYTHYTLHNSPKFNSYFFCKILCYVSLSSSSGFMTRQISPLSRHMLRLVTCKYVNILICQMWTSGVTLTVHTTPQPSGQVPVWAR